MSGGAADASVARARALRDFRRAQRPRQRLSLYRLYLVVLFGWLGIVLTRHALAALLGPGVGPPEFVIAGPALLLVLTVFAIRFGTWNGPVGFSRPDVALLLSAPVAIAVLVRAKLDQALLVSVVAGAVAGVAVVLIVSGGPVGLGAPRVIGTALSAACVSVALVASSWLVQSSHRLARLTRRAGPLAWLPVIGIAVPGWTLGKGVAVWLGPWGWALAPLAGGSAWPVVTALLGCSAALLVVAGRRRVGCVDAEMFAAHADVRAKLGASAFTMNYRSAALVYRAAASAPTELRLLRRSLPRNRRLLVVCRDAIALGYEPFRVLCAVLLTVAATLEAATQPGLLVPALLAAAAIYLAATLLAEPARVDVDSPDRVRLLTSRPFARVLVEHSVLPVGVLLTVASLSVLGMVVTGSAVPLALLVIPVLVVPGVAIASLGSVLAARRGGRIDQLLLMRMLTADTSNPGDAIGIMLSLAPFFIVTLLTVGVPVALVGDAIAHNSRIAAVAASMGAAGIGAACWLFVLALRTRPPE